MNTLNGRVAAVTGAASGIGHALARELAARGCHLALSDVNDAGLAETVALCEPAGVKITSQHLDVADREAVHAWADQVVVDHGRVNLIFNNAGVALIAGVETMSYEDFEWLMGINFWGVVHGTKAFLPHLKTAGEGHIVNVSSIFGLVSIRPNPPTTQPSSPSAASPRRSGWSCGSRAPTSPALRSIPAGSRRTSCATAISTR